MCHSPSPSTSMPDGNDGRWYERSRTEIYRDPLQRSIIKLIARAEGSLEGSLDMDMLHTKCPPWSDMKPLRGSQKFEASGQLIALGSKLLDVIWQQSIWNEINCTILMLNQNFIYVLLQLRVQNAVSAQPCVGKLGISLVLLNFLGCNLWLWFETT